MLQLVLVAAVSSSLLLLPSTSFLLLPLPHCACCSCLWYQHLISGFNSFLLLPPLPFSCCSCFWCQPVACDCCHHAQLVADAWYMVAAAAIAFIMLQLLLVPTCHFLVAINHHSLVAAADMPSTFCTAASVATCPCCC